MRCGSESQHVSTKRLRRPGTLGSGAPFRVGPRPQARTSRDRAVIGRRADLRRELRHLPAPPTTLPLGGACRSPPRQSLTARARRASPLRRRQVNSPVAFSNSQRRARAGVRSSGGRRGRRGTRGPDPGTLGSGADLGREERRGLPCGRVARPACPRVRVG